MATIERPKLIYRAEPHPGFDQAAFTARWRQHAKLGMSQPRWKNVHRYVHCDPIEPAALRLGACSGIAMIWYKSEENRLAHVGDEGARCIMRADEAETFARPVREFSALVREIELMPVRPAPAKCFVFLRFHAAPAEIDLRAWGEYRRERLSSVPGLSSYRLNQRRTDAAAQGLGLDWHAIEEIGCAAPSALPVPGDIADSEAIWTREVVLHQADQ